MTMPEQPFSNILPSESELRELIVQMMQTNPSQIPALLLQIQLERFMLQTLDKLMGEFETSIKQLGRTIDNQ
jgi:hypothetical protein